VGSTEVIRGSASALYGNASGGVIDLRTRPAPADPIAGQVRGWGGSYGFRRWTGVAGGTYGPFTYQGDIDRTTNDGYRAFSHQHVTNGYGRVGFSSGNTDYAVQFLGYDMPTAENPGALTKALLDSSPRLADPQSVIKQASKASTQYQLGVQATHHLNAGELVASLYGGTRTLDNPLTFAIVGFDR
jgi:iron complex outermembrane receptor protein